MGRFLGKVKDVFTTKEKKALGIKVPETSVLPIVDIEVCSLIIEPTTLLQGVSIEVEPHDEVDLLSFVSYLSQSLTGLDSDIGNVMDEVEFMDDVPVFIRGYGNNPEDCDDPLVSFGMMIGGGLPAIHTHESGTTKIANMTKESVDDLTDVIMTEDTEVSVRGVPNSFLSGRYDDTKIICHSLLGVADLDISTYSMKVVHDDITYLSADVRRGSVTIDSNSKAIKALQNKLNSGGIK